MKLQHALKTFACRVGLLLLQVGAAQAIEGFGALRVVLAGLLEKRVGLFERAAYEKHKAQGKIVSRKVIGLAESSERKRLAQALRMVPRKSTEVCFVCM